MMKFIRFIDISIYIGKIRDSRCDEIHEFIGLTKAMLTIFLDLIEKYGAN